MGCKPLAASESTGLFCALLVMVLDWTNAGGNTFLPLRVLSAPLGVGTLPAPAGTAAPCSGSLTKAQHCSGRGAVTSQPACLSLFKKKFKKNIKKEMLCYLHINYMSCFLFYCVGPWQQRQVGVGGMAVGAEPSHQYSITCCCHVADGSRGALWHDGVWHGSACGAKVCHWIPSCGKSGTHWHSWMLTECLRRWAQWGGELLLLVQIFMSAACRLLFIAGANAQLMVVTV